jgi:choline dehydrogenase-like flavoprotein
MTLASNSPTATTRFDPKFLTHLYDRRILIEGIRQTMQILSAPVYATTTVQMIGPKADSDEAIWEHIKRNTNSSWHMLCTARMGRDERDACVDSEFKVFGLEALRIVDFSVCPFVPK